MSDIVERLRGKHQGTVPLPEILHEAADEIERLQGELVKATRLVGQSIQWQRDAEIKLLKLRAATLEECAIVADHLSERFYGAGAEAQPELASVLRDCAAAIRALKEQK